MSWCAVPRRAVFCLLAAGLSFIPFQDTRAAEAISGFDFLSQQNQELQQDNFANPGYLWVEAGAARFAEDGCTDCHPQGSMRGVAVKFPRLDTATGLLENLETQINQCRTEQTKRKVYGYESQALLSLTTYISAQSAGLRWSLGSPAGSSGILPVALKTAMDRGEAYFRERRGQQNLSCAHCHEQNAGQRLRQAVV